MRAALALLVIAFAILLAPAHTEPGTPRIAAGYATQLVETGLLELPPASELRSIVRAGRRRADVSIIDVGVALPGAIVAHALKADDRVRAGAALIIPAALLASIIGIFFARLRRERGLGLPLGPALGATLSLLLATSFVMALRRPDATLVTTLALVLLLDRLSAGDTRSPLHFVQLGLLAATMTLAQPVYLLTAIALMVLDLVRRRARVLGVLLAMVPLVLGAIAARVWSMRIGAPTPSSDSLFEGIYGLVLSPGRSLFVYSPLTIVGVLGLSRLWARDRHRAEAILVAALTALLAIATRADWHGDPAFGAPLVVPLLPLLIEPAAMLIAARAGRALFIAAALAGMCLQLLGLSVDIEAWPRIIADVRVATNAPGWFLDPAADIEFVPQLSPIVGQATLLPIAIGKKPQPTPPFALVVGSDQAFEGKPNQGWQDVSARIDRTRLRPNLTLAQCPLRIARIMLGAWMALVGVAFMLLARARRSA